MLPRSLQQWLNRRSEARRNRRRARPRLDNLRSRFTPRFELLEDRLTPSGFSLGDAANYGILYEGNGGKTLAANGFNVAGNIGIGGTGVLQAE